ncbi:MAG: right-handed parallel beta-helix repeat-containing protein [Planctomycetota bacterium]|jgi:predicted outer membrane repeat protein
MKRTILVIISLLSVSTALGAGRTIIVDDDGPADFNNIQAAIDDSNDGDIIYVLPGTYTGPGNRGIDFGGRAITVQSVLPEDPYIVSVTIIDCEGMGRGFLFQSGEDSNSVLGGLTITNGAASGGAGVACNSSHPTVSNCVITGNWARTAYPHEAYGGGVYCSYSEAAFINCTISDNRAGGPDDTEAYGGGVYCRSGSLKLSNCTIAHNISRANRAYGGGIYSRSATIINCTISGNRVEKATYRYGSGGGGLFCSGGTIRGCTISGNSSERDGGGIYCWGTRTIEDCVLVNNQASKGGGGLYNLGATGKVIGCEFNGNSAGNGGAVYYDQSCLVLTSCTLSGNWAFFGAMKTPMESSSRPRLTAFCRR